MTEALALSLAREALWLMVLASLPPLGASLVVGLATSAFQAVTGLQEVTVSVVPRLAAAVLALVVAGPWISTQLSRFATAVLLSLAEVRG